jgi:site-specific DNA-methyltransferase (adenine-specific)
MGKKLLGSLQLNRIYQMEALEGMKLIPDHSIEMILCDLPYGMTSHGWDTIIPFEPLWTEYERIIKDNSAIVLTGSQPFTTKLIASNLSRFKYCWVWGKSSISNPLNAHVQSLKNHEDIAVFGRGKVRYYPQGLKEYTGPQKKRTQPLGGCKNKDYEQTKTGYPKSILNFKSERGLHPTQKPVGLFEYLIKTYTNKGDIVLDNCMGSRTTAVAATICNRKWIGFETESRYVEIANKRLDSIQVADDLNRYS